MFTVFRHDLPLAAMTQVVAFSHHLRGTEILSCALKHVLSVPSKRKGREMKATAVPRFGGWRGNKNPKSNVDCRKLQCWRIGSVLMLLAFRGCWISAWASVFLKGNVIALAIQMLSIETVGSPEISIGPPRPSLWWHAAQNRRSCTKTTKPMPSRLYLRVGASSFTTHFSNPDLGDIRIIQFGSNVLWSLRICGDTYTPHCPLTPSCKRLLKGWYLRIIEPERTKWIALTTLDWSLLHPYY